MKSGQITLPPIFVCGKVKRPFANLQRPNDSQRDAFLSILPGGRANIKLFCFAAFRSEIRVYYLKQFQADDGGLKAEPKPYEGL